MTNELRTEIENAIYDGLAEIWCITREHARQRFSLDYHPTLDKDVDPDDIDMVLIPDLHKKFRIEIPAVEWSRTGTIGEAVELIGRYVTEAQNQGGKTRNEKEP